MNLLSAANSTLSRSTTIQDYRTSTTDETIDDSSPLSLPASDNIPSVLSSVSAVSSLNSGSISHVALDSAASTIRPHVDPLPLSP